jgi:amino-acid N-acetyltransferase
MEPRTPPLKIRVTKLQEAQVRALVRIEEACAAEVAAGGIEPPAPRSEIEIVRLTRTHDVLVAEADDEVAGYLAWADQAPGVAFVDALVVDGELRHFGVATRLLRELGQSVRQHGIEHVVARAPARSASSVAFLAARGFLPLDRAGRLPDKLGDWAERNAADAAAEGEQLWWRESKGLGLVPGLPEPV